MCFLEFLKEAQAEVEKFLKAQRSGKFFFHRQSVVLFLPRAFVIKFWGFINFYYIHII